MQFEINLPQKRITPYSEEVQFTITERNQKTQTPTIPQQSQPTSIKHSGTQKTQQAEKIKKEETSQTPTTINSNNLQTQTQVIEHLKGRIIAQDKAIEDVVATLFLNQTIIESGNTDMITTSKANVLIDGPTGTGKTMLIKELSKLMSLPMVNTSITSYSTTGYKGNDLENILIKLLDQANGDQELAERGIICLDEFDKLGAFGEANDLSMRKALQEELLTYLSGAKFDIQYKGKKIEFDTSKITFVALGAFTNLRERKIAENEKKYKSSIGFGTNISSKDYQKTIEINTDDYIQEGIIREIVGRLTTKTYTVSLSVEDYKDIMLKSGVSPLKSLATLCELHGKTLVYDDETVTYIAELAYKNKTGARGLQNIFNGLNRRLIKNILEGKEKTIAINIDMVTEITNEKVRKYK